MKDYFPGNLGGNDRRFTRNNRSYDTTLTRNLDQRSGNYRNNNYQRRKSGPDATAEALNENLVVIKEQLQTISDVQKRMAAAQERRADAEERNAVAMERIAESVARFIGGKSDNSFESDVYSENIATREDTQEDIQIDTQDLQEDPPPVAKSNGAVKIISEMRQNGISYDKIAEHLTEQDVPTPSGRGTWNRRTVSRVYQETPVN
jgi:hypothetical protein